MDNPKQQKGKFAQFITSRGFYAAIAVCLAGAGVATWLAVDRTITGIENSNAQMIQNETKYQEFPTPGEAEKKAPEVPVIKKESDVPVESKAQEPAPSKSSTPSASSAQPAAAASQPSDSAAVSQPSAEQPISAKLSYTLPVKGDILNPFSEGELVKNVTLNDWRTHDGVDIACDKGTEVLAAADGTVLQVKADAVWGTIVTIEHVDGRQTIYSGLGDVIPVKEGEAVLARQVIGKAEGVPCESAEGCHLHFAMRTDGAFINPLSIIAQA